MEKRNGYANSCGRWLAAAALAALSLSAHAFKADKNAEAIWRMQGNTAAMELANGAARAEPLTTTHTANGPTLGGKKPHPWPGKAQAEHMAKWKALATPNSLAKSIMKPGAIVTLVAGAAISQLLDLACVKLAGGSMQLNDSAQWMECKFSQQETRMWWVNGVDMAHESTGSAACQSSVSKVVAGGHANYEANANGISGFCFYYRSNGTYYTAMAVVSQMEMAEVQDGYQEADPAAVEQELTQKISDMVASDYANAPDVENSPQSATQRLLRELLDGGAKVEVGTPQVSGPASVPGNPVVTKTTEPNGQGGTREKTTTTTTTNNYTYNDNSVTVTQTTTVTNTYDDGTPAEEEVKEETDERTECEKNPDAFDCNPPEVPDGDVPKTSKAVTFGTENLGWGYGSCPTSPSWTDRLGTHTLNLGPICSMVASIVKPLVLAMAALMALAIAMPAVREA
jgi:hypothetical protein